MLNRIRICIFIVCVGNIKGSECIKAMVVWGWEYMMRSFYGK